MTSYALTHLSDEALLHGLSALVTQDRTATAAVLAHIAEVDERKPYLPPGWRRSRRPHLPGRPSDIPRGMLRFRLGQENCPRGQSAGVSPLSSQSHDVQYTMSQRAHDLLCTAQALLAHQIPSGDIAQVVERGLRPGPLYPASHPS